MRRSTETRFYLAAFIAVGLITLAMCSYGYGRTAELIRERQERDAMVEQAVADRHYWHARYDVLSHEADWLTLADAEDKFQGSRR